MPQPPNTPRKRRTRQHVIADQSVNHVERVILDEGHTVSRLATDYGYDLLMQTFDADGYAEPGLVFFQLKASESLVRVGENYFYDLDIRDYNLWKSERLPVVLVLYDAGTRRAYWAHVQGYFASGARRPRKTAKTVRVSIHRRRLLDRRAVQAIRVLKAPVTVHIVVRVARCLRSPTVVSTRSSGRSASPPPCSRRTRASTRTRTRARWSRSRSARTTAPVLPHHLVGTRMVLDGYGIVSPPEFAAQLQAG